MAEQPAPAAALSASSNASKPAAVAAASQSSSSSSSDAAGVAEAGGKRKVRVAELPFVRRVIGICLWSNFMTSSLTLLCLLLLLFLLSRGYTLLTLVSYLLMLQLLTCFFFINASKLILKLKGQEAAKPATAQGGAAGAAVARPEYVSESTLSSLLPLVHSSLNVLLESSHDLIRCTDNALTLRVIAVLLCLSILGRMFDGVTVATLLVIAAMTVPKGYLMHKSKVDAVVAQIQVVGERAWMVLGAKVKDAAAGKSKTA